MAEAFSPKAIAKRFLARAAPTVWKRRSELRYWRVRAKAEEMLSNDHYKHFYTTHFGLSDADYVDKVVLDIGCGPRGSLEWASMARRRIGLDPLSREYMKLGASAHAMEYICAGSEAIPLPDRACDIVCSYNSLDHVDNVERSVSEIKRITQRGGLLLLLVEVNHPPTDCEPHQLTPAVVDALAPEFKCESLAVYVPAGAHGIYQSILTGKTFPAPEATTEVGWLSARFRRV